MVMFDWALHLALSCRGGIHWDLSTKSTLYSPPMKPYLLGARYLGIMVGVLAGTWALRGGPISSPSRGVAPYFKPPRRASL